MSAIKFEGADMYRQGKRAGRLEAFREVAKQWREGGTTELSLWLDEQIARLAVEPEGTPPKMSDLRQWARETAPRIDDESWCVIENPQGGAVKLSGVYIAYPDGRHTEHGRALLAYRDKVAASLHAAERNRLSQWLPHHREALERLTALRLTDRCGDQTAFGRAVARALESARLEWRGTQEAENG